MKQTKKDNNKIDHTCAVYAKNDTKLSGLIKPVQLVMKTKRDNNVIDRICEV